jgi:hypothetical protein
MVIYILKVQAKPALLFHLSALLHKFSQTTPCG